jgi:ATP-dependent Clp protease protease subunit
MFPISYNPNNIFFRDIVISGMIDESITKEVIQRIHIINQIDRESGLIPPPFIKITLNSVGGSMYDGFAIVGAIELSETPIHITCLGSVMSMALPILVAGDYRTSHKLSTFMYHECLNDSLHDKISVIHDDLEEARRLMKQYDNYLVSRTLLKLKQLDKIKKDKNDWYFGAEDALKFGIIDQIYE